MFYERRVLLIKPTFFQNLSIVVQWSLIPSTTATVRAIELHFQFGSPLHNQQRSLHFFFSIKLKLHWPTQKKFSLLICISKWCSKPPPLVFSLGAFWICHPKHLHAWETQKLCRKILANFSLGSSSYCDLRWVTLELN